MSTMEAKDFDIETHTARNAAPAPTNHVGANCMGVLVPADIPDSYVSYKLHMVAKKVKITGKCKATTQKHSVDEASEALETKRRRLSFPL
jgi:hypothetical protein